jgi:hypothetical protein
VSTNGIALEASFAIGQTIPSRSPAKRDLPAGVRRDSSDVGMTQS